MKPVPPNLRVFGVELPGRPESAFPWWNNGVTLSVDEVKLIASKVELGGVTAGDLESIRQGPRVWGDIDQFRALLFAFANLALFVTPEFAFGYAARTRTIDLIGQTEAARRSHPVVGIVRYLLDVQAEFRRQEALADVLDHLNYETGVLPGRLACEMKQCFMDLDDFDFDDAVSAVRHCRDAAHLRTLLRDKYPGRPTILVRDEKDWEQRHAGQLPRFAGASTLPRDFEVFEDGFDPEDPD